MYLSLLYPNPDHPRARKDLADPYSLHQSLAHAVAPGDRPLWRLESGRYGEDPRVLLQTLKPPDWERFFERQGPGYAELAPDSPKRFDPVFSPGQLLRFRLHANPTVSRAGKRLGLYREEEQRRWIEERLKDRGAELLSVLISQREKRRFTKNGQTVTLAVARFDGVLRVTDPERLRQAIANGIGHGKAFGLGLLSVAPYRG